MRPPRIRLPHRSTRFGTALILAVCPIIYLLIAGCADGTLADDGPALSFEDVTIVDAAKGLRSGQNVIVRGNRIVAAGPKDTVQRPSGATVIDGKGKYLIPGLWDAHVHLTNSSALHPAMYPLLIANGITYVRDTAAELELIKPLLQEAEEASRTTGMAPRIFFTGPHLDGSQLSWSSSVSAATVEKAREIMDRLETAGVDQIKVYDLLPPDVCLAVLSLARSRGLKVSAHVPLGLDVVEASNAGLSAMEHMYNLEMSCSSDWEALLQARRRMMVEGSGKGGRQLRNDIYSAQRMHAFRTQDPDRRNTVLQALARNNTWQVPTLVIVAAAENRLFARDDYRSTFRYLPEPVRSAWEKAAHASAGRAPAEASLAHANWAYDMIPRLAAAGVGIMAGTDMPLAQLVPGFSLHEELALLVRAGLTPLQALESATLRPAQFFGLEGSQGSIAKGMMADLVLLDANPLDDITHTQRIAGVMRNGHFHSRTKLDAVLSRLEKRKPD